jgi:2-polyprenyl-6-methoxyphenol hydroxylase-like FAD-dependent oxidoreductase
VTSPSIRALQIGIVGGSISGCAAAIALARAGHAVTVVERSRGDLKGRGAGIGTPRSAIASLRERDMVGPDLHCFEVGHFSHIGGASRHGRFGRTAWKTPVTIDLLNWGDLYRDLRRRVPDAVYRRGCEVTAVEPAESARVHLESADGRVGTFDVVVFADGYRSLGRRLVCPESALEYRGYVLWRGVLEERQLDDVGPLEGTLCRLSYPAGHAVVYLVPGADGSVAKGRRWVNWACYVRVTDERLPAFLTDRWGQEHVGSLPPGSMPDAEEGRLKQLARDSFPPYFADIMTASERTFVQAIYTAAVPRYGRDRLCLTGDAGAFVQPFTASGVFKGMHNAVALADALAGPDDVDAALEDWSRRETETGARQVALGRQLEQALIWNVPDFGELGEEATRAWWDEAAKMPEDLFPSGDGAP